MLFYLSILETEEQKKNFIEIYGRNRGSMYCVVHGILDQKEEAELYSMKYMDDMREPVAFIIAG